MNLLFKLLFMWSPIYFGNHAMYNLASSRLWQATFLHIWGSNDIILFQNHSKHYQSQIKLLHILHKGLNQNTTIKAINHFTTIGQYIGQEGHTGSCHVAHCIEGFDSIPASQVLLKSAKVWPSLRQIKSKGCQQHFTAHYAKKGEKDEF